MAAQRIVYIVTSGSYSSYRIEAAYSTRKRADAHCAAAPPNIRGDPPEVEEWPLDVLAAPLARGYRRYSVWFAPNGDLGSAEQIEFGEATDLSSPDQYPFCPDGRFGICVLAKDEGHAIKIAADQRAQTIAEAVEKTLQQGNR